MGALMPADLLVTLGALPVPEPLDHPTGDSVVAALLQVPVAGLRPERVLGVGDAIALAVLQDMGGGLLPGALALDAGGRLAEFAEPAGPLKLQRP
jgi:hypothetical protein